MNIQLLRLGFCVAGSQMGIYPAYQDTTVAVRNPGGYRFEVDPTHHAITDKAVPEMVKPNIIQTRHRLGVV